MFVKRDVVVVLLAALFGTSVSAAAQPKRQPVPEEYTGTTTNMKSGSGTKLLIQILRWSSEEDRERVQSVLSRLPQSEESQPDPTSVPDLAKALKDVETAGYIWSAGPLGYSLKYAHRSTEPDGRQHVVLVTDRPLAIREHSDWEIEGAAKDAPFTVVELRLDKKGMGDGKMSWSAVAIDEVTHTIGVADYETLPVLLEHVQHLPKPYWAREG